MPPSTRSSLTRSISPLSSCGSRLAARAISASRAAVRVAVKSGGAAARGPAKPVPFGNVAKTGPEGRGVDAVLGRANIPTRRQKFAFGTTTKPNRLVLLLQVVGEGKIVAHLTRHPNALAVAVLLVAGDGLEQERRPLPVRRTPRSILRRSSASARPQKRSTRRVGREGPCP